MATIAKLAVMLTADIGGFSTGMARAAKPLAKFAGGVTSAAAKVGGLLSAITGLVGAGSIAVLTHQSMDAIDATAKLADRLGATTEGLVGLRHGATLAGVSGDDLTNSLQRMLKSVGDANAGLSTASDAFKVLGLDSRKLANMKTEDAFAAIAESVKNLQNPAERTKAIMDIFGRSGANMANLLMQGKAGIEATRKEAERLGITFSRVDAAKVEAANDAMTRMKAVVTGVGNQLAIGLAPYVDAAATKLTKLATEGGGIGPKVGGAIEWVTKAIAAAADYLNLLKAGFKLMQAGATLAVLGVVKSIDLMGKAIVWVLNKIPGVKVQFTSFFSQMSDGLVQDVNRLTSEAGAAFNSFKRGDNAKAVTRLFDQIRANSQKTAEGVAANAAKIGGAFRDIGDGADNLKKAADTLAQIEKQTAQVGLSDSQKKLADLQALGARPEQIARARQLLALQEQVANLAKIDTGDPLTDFAAKMEKLQKLYAQGKLTAEQFAAIRNTAKETLTDKLSEQARSITDSVRTPLEQYQAEIEKLNTLLERGLITKQTFDRAALKAKSVLDSPQEKQPAAPKLLRANSAEAQRFAFDQAPGVQRLGKDDVPRKQLAEARFAGRMLDRIERNTRNAATTTEQVMDI